MNVFVLCTGRSGSKTFYKACTHITNYTSGHETNISILGKGRLEYKDQHIEVDNRLSWLLGRLEQRYGNDAFYVHLNRDKYKTAESFDKRWRGNFSIINAYAKGILNRRSESIKECLDYYRTVNANIRLFLNDKNKKLTIHLSNIEEEFPEFWEAIEAEGDLNEALSEFKVRHNISRGYLNKRIKHLVWKLKNLFRWV